MDVMDQVGAVTREARTTQREGRPAKTVLATRAYDAGIADVWDALTNAERLPRWFLPVSGDLRLGGRYQFDGNAGGVVERCEPPERFAVTWEFGGEVSWLEVRLAEAAGGTTLVLEHSAHVEPDRWTEYGPGAVGVGWDLGLYGLGQHLSTGSTVDPATAAAWLGSPPGRAFVGAASTDWARASVADGADLVAAAAAAGRVSAFYTGDPDPTGVGDHTTGD